MRKQMLIFLACIILVAIFIIAICYPKKNNSALEISYMRVRGESKCSFFMHAISSQNTPLLSEVNMSNCPLALQTPLWKRASSIGKEAIAKRQIADFDIGYLFLKVENKSSHGISHITVCYDNISLTKRIAEKDISTTSTSYQCKKIPYLHQGQSFIWLIQMYKADNNDFPEYFIADVTIPTSITYRWQGSYIEESIRRPLKEEAMRVALPRDWPFLEDTVGHTGQ